MVSEQAICGISSKRIVGATHGGSSCGWHPDLYSGGVYGGGARHLFDETPSHREATTGDVLRVTVSHVLYPVTEGVLHQVFDLYGAEQVVVLERADHVEALVRFRSSRDAERARDVTHGRCVYDGCCWLDVQYMQSIPSDSIVVMPVTCSTLGLSPNTDVSMATTTSAATTLTTSTTSAAATMTSLVTRAREAPRDELKELAPVETSKEPKKTVKEMCEKILATLNSMIEGGRDINLDITSNVVEAAGYNVVSLPTFPTTVELSDIIVSSPMPPVIADSVLDQDSASHKVLEERSDMSTVVLWPPPMKWDERQLWPPPSRVVIKCIVGSNLIPIAKSLFGLSSGSLFGLLTFSSKKGLYDVQGPIPIVKNVSIPPDSDDILLVNLEDIMPLCYFWVPVDSCKNRIAEALDTIKPISSWEMTTTASQVQDHALDHTRGFGVVVDALVNYLSLEYGIMFELARIFAFLSGPPNYGAGLFAFQEMKKAGVNSDVYTYTILIDSFCKAGLIEHAQSWFDEMRSVSCSPNVVTYTALLHAYLKAKQLLLANDIFHRMVDTGCCPNGITYSALIDGLCKSDTIAPHVVTYGALIDGLCKAHKVADAHELLDAMLSVGCEPNHIVYDAWIDGFCKVGKIDNAQEVFLQLTKCGYLPSVHTYTSLIDRMFKKGFHSDILKSTNNFDQDNVIGCGGFGLVYKATLPDGATIAIKRLSSDFGQMKCEFKAEVETLSKAQHRNLVLLQGYCRIGSDKLLIYSYMENGSLDHWLHEKSDGPSRLSWQRRLQIAKGAARGLAYLHLSCRPHILQRDIKSSNILLDEKSEAHLADCIESAWVANPVQASQPTQLGFDADPIGDVTAVKLKNGRVLEVDIVVLGQIFSRSAPVHDKHLQVL